MPFSLHLHGSIPCKQQSDILTVQLLRTWTCLSWGDIFIAQSPSLSHPTPNACYASNGHWHDNMLKQAIPIVNHHQRISRRENYLAVVISRRDCLMHLGIISGTDLLWKISVGGRRWLPWWVQYCWMLCVFWRYEILVGKISPQNLKCLPSH